MDQVAAAMRFLPPEAIHAFNIGNEPDLFAKDRGFPGNYYKVGWYPDMNAYTTALSPLLLQYFGTNKMVSGRALGPSSSVEGSSAS